MVDLDVVLRFWILTFLLRRADSSEPGVPNLDDRVPQPRGLGIKVFGVEGTKLDGKINNTQDFEFNSCNILELGSAQTAFEIIGLRESLVCFVGLEMS